MVGVATLAEGPCYQRMKPGTTLCSLHWGIVHDLVARRRESGCTGSGCCLAGIKGSWMVLPWSGHRDSWLLGKPVGTLGVPRLFGRNDQLVGLDGPEGILEEAGILISEAPGSFGADILAAEGCALDMCYRAEDKVTPGCMQEAGLKVAGIDPVAAEELGQGAAHSLRTDC